MEGEAGPDLLRGLPTVARELQLLTEITEKINSGNTLEEVFELIYDRLRGLIPQNRIAVALLDDQGEKLVLRAARSDGDVLLARGYAGPIAGSSLEPLILEGKTRIINDLEEYLARKPHSDSTRLMIKEGMRSSLTLPLIVQGRPVGVMFFSSRRKNAYVPQHEALLKSVVGHMAIAVERSHLIDELRAKSDYLENILQNSADAIVVCDAEDRIRTWNEGARRIFGFEPEEVLGKPYSLFIPPEDRASDEETRLRKQMERDGYLNDHECVRLAKDGRRIVVRVTSTLLWDKRGRAIGRSCIVRDVTHLKALQAELVKSQSLAAVGELAATVAHEIKNPLAGISGAIQVLEEAIPSTDRRRGVVREILGQIQRLDNTVRDLLTYARPATPSLQEIDLVEALRRTWALLATQPSAAAVRFHIESPKEVRARADAMLLQQVWLNLFQNAIEAMPRGGDLRVQVEDGPVVRVRIADTGTGVDPGHAGDLFRPFFSTKTRGTGLGLAISKKIVEAHGGTIRMESIPEHGTTVTLEILR